MLLTAEGRKRILGPVWRFHSIHVREADGMEKKNDFMKSILVYVGVLLILTGSMAVKNEILTFFFIGLALLAVQTFGLPSVDRKRLAVAETVLSGAVAVAGVVQLTAARSFGTSQVFMLLLVIGALLVVVESVRKLTE
jgi:hypothetical protein